MPLALNSQTNTKRERFEFLKSQKIAFITEKLSLTPQEAETFWPVYNEFSQKRKALNQQKNEIEQKLKNTDSLLNDNQKFELSDNLIELYEEDAQIRKQYHEEFKKVLPINKVILLYKAEEDFKTFLLNQIRSNNIQNTLP